MAACLPLLPSFERSISLNDLDSALNVREQVQKDLVVPEDAEHRYLQATPHFSFVLPSFRQFDALDFRKFLYSSLVDVVIFKELENAKILNWCEAVHAMVPLLTLGDGNCLMHAASLAMWGVNDRYQILRRAVFQCLLEDAQGMYHRRWQHEQEQIKQRFLGGYELTEEQWKEEWQQIIDQISPTEFPMGRSGAQFGSLEETHIFVLANVLRRSIIVLCDDTLHGNYGEPFSPVTFGGIYLPLNWDPLDCVKSPLVIAYAQGHFTSVVSLKDGMLDLGGHSFISAENTMLKHAIALVKSNGSPLPVHFLLASEQSQESGLLRQYLDCAKVHLSQGVTNQAVGSDAVLIAKLNLISPLPDMEKLTESYFHRARDMYKHMVAQRQTQPQVPVVPLLNQGSAKACSTPGCTFYGRSENAGWCSICLTKYLSSLNVQEPSLGNVVHQQHQPTANQQASVTPQSPPVHYLHPASVSPTCQTSGCKYAAAAGKGGLCMRCYEAERSAEEMAASVEYQSIHGEHCANQGNGCDFFGVPQQHNLCSRCFRHFCVRLEDTLGEQMPNSPGAMGRPSTPPANPCQGANCRKDGVAALYNMCLGCYTTCIRAFINSDGKSVGSTIAPPPEAPPVQGTKPVVFKRGVLCASAGCFNERIPQLNDLCSQCYQSSKGLSAVATAAASQIPGLTTAPVPAGAMAAVNAAVTTTSISSPRLTPALLQAMGQRMYCSNGKCMEYVGSNAGGCCTACYSTQLPGSSSVTKLHDRQLPSGLPPSTSPTLTTPSAPCMSYGQIHSMYEVPSLQSGNTVPGASLSERVAPSQASVASPGQLQEVHKSVLITNSNPTQTSPCITPNCTSPGSAERNFLCIQCYKKNIAEWKRIGGTPVAPGAGCLQQQKRSAVMPCIMEGCNNPSDQNSNQLCTPCFRLALRQENQWVSQQKQAQARSQVKSTESRTSGNQPRQAKPFYAAAIPCKTVGCLNFGTSEKNGLCDNCFNQNPAQAAEPPLRGTRRMVRSPPASPSPESQPVSLVTHTLTNQGPIQVASGSIMMSRATPQDIANAQRCCRPMCTMFGTSEMGGLCSLCFAEKTIVSSYPNSVPDAPPSSLSSSTSEASDTSVPPTATQRECLNAACTNLANPHLYNHCTECFTKLYPELAQREEYKVCFEGAN